MNYENIEKLSVEELIAWIDRVDEETLEGYANYCSKKMTFKDRYQDPVYRRKHCDYMLEKVECQGCGFITSRSNMTRHRQSSNHKKRMELGDRVELFRQIEKRKKDEAILTKLQQLVEFYKNK